MKIKKLLYTIFVIILICFAYLALSFSPIFFQDLYQTETLKPIITAHRGASSLAPENTLASIKAALKLNPDRIEIDVQQTLDSVVVLMHDITLNRTTNGTGLIKEKTFKAISKLDAGSWFSSTFIGEKIPILEDAIQLTKGKCQLIIEIKKGSDFYPNIEKNILNLIVKHNAEKWVIIHSFDYAVLEKIHNLNSNIPIHKLFFGKLKSLPYVISNKLEYLDIEKYTFIKEYSINYVFANKETISYLKSKDKKINVWTVNDYKNINELMALGIDGIITDNPNVLNKQQ